MALSAQLTHFGVHTADLDRMVDFYTRVMGFVVSDSGIGRSGARVFFMTRAAWMESIRAKLNARP